MKLGRSIVWVMVAGASTPALAVDRWEAVSAVAPIGDNDSSTINELLHGVVQVGHDFSSGSDQDWVKVTTRSYRSYEARVSSGSVPWQSASCPPATCAVFDMVDAGGSVVQPGVWNGSASSGISVSWTSGITPATVLLRAASNTGLTGHTYDMVLFDTTLTVPRFNNSDSQVSVLILQNARAVSATGFIHFFGTNGTILHSANLAIGPNETLVLQTAGIQALQNTSGSILVAQTGGYGALSGKAVAVEPATGFTFDTALTPIPH